MNIQIFKPLLKNNEKKHHGLQQTVNELAKDGLSQCNMPSFASQFTAYWQALDLQPLIHNRKTRQKQATHIHSKPKTDMPFPWRHNRLQGYSHCKNGTPLPAVDTFSNKKEQNQEE